MNYTKEQIEDIVKSILSDIEYSFIEDALPNNILLVDGSGGQVPNYYIRRDDSGKFYRELASRK